VIERIEDANDPRIEAYRDIRERDLKGRAGAFVLEGEIVLKAALRAGRFAVRSLLVGENRVEPLAELLAQVPASVPVYVAGRAVLDAVAGFPLHRGVLALGLRGEPKSPAELVAGLPAQALVMVLSAIANHDNMGGLFRNAAAFGVDAVLLDEACCDPLYRKAIRVSAGAAVIVPFAQGGSAQTLCEELLAAGFSVLATSPRGIRRLKDVTPSPRQAVLFGAEGPGLPQALIDRLDSVRIDMAGGFDSLNVATTAGIVLHQLRA